MTAKPPFSPNWRSARKKAASSGWNRDGQPSVVESPRSFSSARATALLCLLLSTALSGCTLCQNVKRTIVDEPTEFSWMGDRKRSVEAYRQWADQAWGEYCSSDPEQIDSSAYAVGFKDGFVDYVYAGGTGEPPPVAPRQFWNVNIRSTHGHAAASDWFAGYRHGAQVAKVKGYRKRAIVPASMFMKKPSNANSDYQPRFIEHSLGPVHENSLQTEPLPAVRLAPNPQPAEPQLELPVVDAPATDVPTYDSIENEAPSLPSTESAEAVPGPPQLPQPYGTEPAPTEPTIPVPRPSSEVDDIFDAPAPDYGSTTIPAPSGVRANHHIDGQQARAAFATAIRTRRLPKPAHATTQSTNQTWISHPDISQTGYQNGSSSRGIRTDNSMDHAGVNSPPPKRISRSDENAAEMFHRMSR